jgi:hypothetical protein
MPSASAASPVSFLAALALGLSLTAPAPPARAEGPEQIAAAYRRGGPPVPPVSDTAVVAEAEEFQVRTPGWQARPWGTNYYAATFANAFLSRKGYLGAPAQCDPSVATLDVRVPAAGRYLALVRYEACYRFETQFRLKIEQGGRVRLDRLYGARDNVRIWAFRHKLQKEVAWPWGAGENLVWEGHDALVDLQPGVARLTLTAGRQPADAARRNVDVVLLTRDHAEVRRRIEKENYLPLDGLLTQAGDVYLKLHAPADGPAVTLTVPNGTEHSPYWVHLRDWKPKTVTVPAGRSSDWVEVGSLLDSLNDGQWTLSARGPDAKREAAFALEFGVRTPAGQVESIKRFDGLRGRVTLAYDANTRYTRRIRLVDDVLYELVDYLKKHPVTGVAPKRTLVYGVTFSRKAGDARYNAAVDEFIRLMGATALCAGDPEELFRPGPVPVRGSVDVRSVPTAKLEEYCKKLRAEGKADKVAVVSLGDEIGLEGPPAADHAGFRAWLKARGVAPAEVDPAAGGDYGRLRYTPTPEAARAHPGPYYWSQIYRYRYGIGRLKERTDILRRYLPHAGTGANFSPHGPHMYLGDTHQWITLFREGGLTMPWGEDYIFQVPVGSPQMNAIVVDMFRAAVRNRPGAPIHYYVMAHSPNNTPAGWRRQFYLDLAHGVRVLNLFEFRPVQAAYTENHVNAPAMYQEVRQALHELGRFEDVVQDGRVLPAQAALWFSEVADVWDNYRPPLGAAKRCLYVALRQQQLPLDFVVEGDDLKAYRVLYLTDANVSRAGSRAIAAWVRGGGRLFATAGAGLLDELNRPNRTLRELLGVEPLALEEAKEPPVRLEKQDLPYARPLSWVRYQSEKIPVFGLRSRLKAGTAEVTATYTDGSPAVTVNRSGKGTATYCAFLPGLSYFQPALPRRPMDRGATDDSMAHFLPTEFGAAAGRVVGAPAADLVRPVSCSSPLVETTVVKAGQGVVIPLINWSPRPVKGLTVTLRAEAPAAAALASGRPVRVERRGGARVFTLDLEVADALILR